MGSDLPSRSGATDSVPRLTEREEADLARRSRAGDRAARDRLVLANLPLAAWVASRHQGYGVPLDDLVSEGSLGLLEAVDRFQPERKLRFATYAMYWVRAYVLRYVQRNVRLVGVGVGPASSRLFFGVRRARARLEADGVEHDEATRTLAARFRTTPDTVAAVERRLAVRDLSLEEPSGEGGRRPVDWIGDETHSPEALCADVEERHVVGTRVARALAALDARERLIVERRLMAAEPPALQEIGRELQVSHERVRQLEARATAKLRRSLDRAA